MRRIRHAFDADIINRLIIWQLGRGSRRTNKRNTSSFLSVCCQTKCVKRTPRGTGGGWANLSGKKRKRPGQLFGRCWWWLGAAHVWERHEYCVNCKSWPSECAKCQHDDLLTTANCRLTMMNDNCRRHRDSEKGRVATANWHAISSQQSHWETK